MKKIIFVSIFAAIVFTGCAIRLSDRQSDSDYYNTIRRGMTLHNFVVISNQNEQILENQKKILENQEKIIKLLEGK